MRIVSWNLRCRSKRLGPQPVLVRAIEHLRPDVLALHEATDPDWLSAELARIGYVHRLASSPARGQRPVLVASTLPCERGDLEAPLVGEAGPENFLHVRFDGWELVAVRVPPYKHVPDHVRWWHALWAMLLPRSDRRVLVAGNLSVDPAKWPERVAAGLRAGWQLPPPEGLWSWMSAKGEPRRLDHALLSPAWPPATAAYVADWTGTVPDCVSDHAALVVEVEAGVASGRGRR